MSFYHIKNIKIDKKNNNISADLADSCLTPIKYEHFDKLFDDETFEEKYANFIYNIVSGNFHPLESNGYSKIMMNSLLKNYYDDAHDIGKLNTYYKYRDVITGILTHDLSKCMKLDSERTLNPDYYYVLTPIEIDGEYKDKGDFYTNKKGELYCMTQKGLMKCMESDEHYGYPFRLIYETEEFIKYNDFLKSNDVNLEMEF